MKRYRVRRQHWAKQNFLSSLTALRVATIGPQGAAQTEPNRPFTLEGALLAVRFLSFWQRHCGTKAIRQSGPQMSTAASDTRANLS